MPDQEKKHSEEMMRCLGSIESKVTSIEKQNFRMSLALIGVIMAQIGVKVMGSDPLLDIATVLAIVGAALLAGVLFIGIRVIRLKKQRVTSTGACLSVMIFLIFVIQILVYFRDIGYLEAQIIYGVRILQNISIVVFAWRMMVDHNIFKIEDKGEDDKGAACHPGEKKKEDEK